MSETFTVDLEKYRWDGQAPFWLRNKAEVSEESYGRYLYSRSLLQA
ncbi:MAG: hypothetical protein ACLRSW_07890 [Christensenellaceae bacterium]